VNRTLETNSNVVKRLTDSGILVYNANNWKDNYDSNNVNLNESLNSNNDIEITVENLKSDNRWIVKGVKQVIFEHIVLLDK